MEQIKNGAVGLMAAGVSALFIYGAYSCYRETGTLSLSGLSSCFLKGTVTSLAKTGADLLKSAYNKGIKPGAKQLYNKALKPVGKGLFNKVLKPGFKQLKHTPKLLEHASQKAIKVINPLSSKNPVTKEVKKGLKKGSHAISKGFKKIFHF
jgi:hypothetical protein